jgi:hypothetical protein
MVMPQTSQRNTYSAIERKPMTKLFLPMFLLLSLASFAQTTYTTTANACSGKINQMCTLPVEDQNHVGSCVIIDNRSPSRIGYMDLSCTFGTNEHHGVYSGFTANPNGTRSPFYGVAHYVSDDGTIHATLNYYATYSTQRFETGFHYQILVGSTIAVQ